MEFRLLGPLELEGEQGVVPLGSGKQRALLAILLLHANEGVSRERLIDELWGEEPPASAAHSLEVYVSRLRKTLQEAGADGLLQTHGSGYRLRVDGAVLDSQRFEELVQDARSKEPAAKAQLLRAALSLWRGPALADVRLPGSERTSVERLAELRLAALEERIEADLSLGRHRELVGELQALVAEHPLRERLRSQHMRALYGAGRQADALDAYRDAQRGLDELGLEPSPELKELQRRILNHDPELRLRLPPEPSRAHAALRRRPLRLFVVCMGLLLVAAAAVAITLTRTSGAGSAKVVAVTNSVALFDPATRRLVADVPTGGLSSIVQNESGPNIAVGLGSVWVCNSDDGTILRLDPRALKVTRTIGLGTLPGAIAVGHGYVWVEPQSADEVIKLDSLGNVVQRIPLRRPPPPFQAEHGAVSVASGRTAVWAVHGLASVAKIDPRSGRVVRDRIGLGGALPGQVLATPGGVWLTVVVEGRVLRLDPSNLAVVAKTAPAGGVGAFWSRLAVGAGGIWISDLGTDHLWRVDETTNQIDGSVAVDRYPLGVVVRGGSVWVANSLAGTIDEIDPATFRVVSRTAVGSHPLDIASGPEGLWVTFGDLALTPGP